MSNTHRLLFFVRVTFPWLRCSPSKWGLRSGPAPDAGPSLVGGVGSLRPDAGVYVDRLTGRPGARGNGKTSQSKPKTQDAIFTETLLSTRRRPVRVTVPDSQVGFHEPLPWFHLARGWRPVSSHRGSLTLNGIDSIDRDILGGLEASDIGGETEADVLSVCNSWPSMGR